MFRMKKIFVLCIILLLIFSCFIFFTSQPQMAVYKHLESSKPKSRFILIDPICLERLSWKLECELPIRIATEIDYENEQQFGTFEGKINLEFHWNKSRGKDFWLFSPISNAFSTNGQIATKRFSTVPFSSFATQFGQNQIPNLDVPIPIQSFLKSWERGKFFECGDGKGRPLLERTDDEKKKQIIPLEFVKRLAEFMDLLERHNATGILMAGTLLGWRRECSIIPHTHDIDLGILREEHSEGLVRALIKSFDGACLLGHLKDSLIIKFDIDGVRIDLFYVYPHPENKTNKSYIAGFRDYNRQIVFWVYPRISEFCAGELLGHLVHFPCNFDAFIISEYGKKWQIDFPSSKYFGDQSPNIENREIRTPEEYAKTEMKIDRRWKYNEKIVNEGLKQMGIIQRRIAILSILDRPELIGEFQFALSTIRCYSLRHLNKYSHFVLISPQNSTKNNQKCAQNDFMFRRHCFVADWMAKNEQFEWILFLDGDIGVVNPHREVEEFIENDNVELIFINRMFNSEIAAGSYLARNTPFVRQFLHSWANFVLPSSFHGTDNGAIHALFMEKYAPLEYQNECQHLLESSKNFGDLNVFEVCVRHFIDKQMVNGTFDGGKVKILGKGRGWFRDGGHTGSRFSSRDFMLHGWKNSTFNKNAFNPWKNPFSPSQHFDNDEFCANGSEWKYEKGFVAKEEEIEQKLQKIIHQTKQQYLSIVNELKLNNK